MTATVTVTTERGAEHAAGVARYVSRLMHAAGFEMSRRIDRWSSSAGYHVSRVGCSSWVAIDYRDGNHGNMPREEYREKMTLARDAIRAMGYTVDDRVWIDTTVPKRRS